MLFTFFPPIQCFLCLSTPPPPLFSMLFRCLLCFQIPISMLFRFLPSPFYLCFKHLSGLFPSFSSVFNSFISLTSSLVSSFFHSIVILFSHLLCSFYICSHLAFFFHSFDAFHVLTNFLHCFLPLYAILMSIISLHICIFPLHFVLFSSLIFFIFFPLSLFLHLSLLNIQAKSLFQCTEKGIKYTH